MLPHRHAALGLTPFTSPRSPVERGLLRCRIVALSHSAPASPATPQTPQATRVSETRNILVLCAAILPVLSLDSVSGVRYRSTHLAAGTCRCSPTPAGASKVVCCDIWIFGRVWEPIYEISQHSTHQTSSRELNHRTRGIPPCRAGLLTSPPSLQLQERLGPWDLRSSRSPWGPALCAAILGF